MRCVSDVRCVMCDVWGAKHVLGVEAGQAHHALHHVPWGAEECWVLLGFVEVCCWCECYAEFAVGVCCYA